MRWLVFSILVLCAPARLMAQEEGAITGAAKEISRLLSLKHGETRIELDRDQWEGATGQKSEEEKQQDQLNAMIKRGIPEEIAKKMMERNDDPRRARFVRHDPFGNAPEGELFEELKIATGSNSGGYSGGGDSRTYRGHGGSVRLMMQVSSKDFALSIKEDKEPFQELRVQDDKRSGLRIVFISPTEQLLFTQTVDGTIRVAQLTETDEVAFRCGGFEALVDTKPKFAAEFRRLVEAVGIGLPYADHEPPVVAAVGRLLYKPGEDTVLVAKELIEKLGDEAYAVRSEAEEEIRQKYTSLRTVLFQEMEDPEVNTEIKIRLSNITKALEVDSSKAEQHVTDRKLLGDVDYLKSIVAEAPNEFRAAIEDRISTLQGSE